MQTDEITRQSNAIFADLDVSFVAFWQDADFNNYVQGYVSDGRKPHVQVLTHLTEFDIPRPAGAWFIVSRDGTLTPFE